jgi:hypothetical protein
MTAGADSLRSRVLNLVGRVVSDYALGAVAHLGAWEAALMVEEERQIRSRVRDGHVRLESYLTGVSE